MASNTDITKAFFDAWQAKDVDAILEFFTEDAVYLNVPMEPANHGKTEIRAFIDGFIGMASQIEFIVHNQIESADGLIMNERTDRFLINDKWLELRVMGVFEFSDGKISAWRDYFDMAAFNLDSAAGRSIST